LCPDPNAITPTQWWLRY